MEQWIKATGKLIYEPKRNDFRKTHKIRTLIVDLPRGSDLDLYYQWFLKKKHGMWLDLQRPMFGLHITVVRGDEKLPRPEFWKKHHGEMVEFEYSPQIYRKFQFWTLPVRSRRLPEIRSELGLSQFHVNHFHDYHMTVGRQYDWQPLVK